MNLDWCSSPTKNALLQAIRDLFTQADQNGEVGIMFSQSQAKGIINLEQRDGVLMVTRKARLTQRKVSNQLDFWAKLLEAAREVYNIQIEQQALHSRFIQYRNVDVEDQEALPSVPRRFLDLALTL
ncbi:MAG: hypothetical protein L6R41_003088 [Letrouitia leprolyta]|nr:MAG: hypothetical protein L6R41_003088 [Letrouitia leprolyta]